MVTTDWRIDPDTMGLTNPDAPRRFTAEEWAQQQWPPCPLCGATVEPEQIYITANRRDFELHGHTYMPGLWSCPRGCNPITGERYHGEQTVSREFGGGLGFRCSCGVDESGLTPEEFEQLRAAHPRR